jgi:hypothetical protein
MAWRCSDWYSEARSSISEDGYRLRFSSVSYGAATAISERSYFNVRSKYPQHTEMSPAIFDHVHGLTLEHCNVKLLRHPDSIELLRSENSAPHKQNPFNELCPMPVIPKLYCHTLRCFPDICLSVLLSTPPHPPPPHLFWGSLSLLLNGHRGIFS